MSDDFFEDEFDEIDGVPVEQEVRGQLDINFERVIDDYNDTVVESHRYYTPNTNDLSFDVLVNKFKRMLNAMGYTYIDALIVKKEHGYVYCDGHQSESYDDATLYTTKSSSTDGYVSMEVK